MVLETHSNTIITYLKKHMLKYVVPDTHSICLPVAITGAELGKPKFL